MATWDLKVNEAIVVPPGTPYLDSNGANPLGLGAINFFSAHATNELYLDDLAYDDEPLPLSIDGFNKAARFIAYPNPTSDILSLEAEEEITSVSFYNILGQQMFTSEINALTTQIDMSTYEAGIYVVKAVVGNSEGSIKVIR